MAEEVPEMMQAVRATAGGLVVEEVPVPVPRADQVLVKMMATPTNPSDLMFMQGKYGMKRAFPTTPGFEGSGVVVANGGSWMGWLMLGKRVAIATNSENDDGTWAQYCVATAAQVMQIPAEMSFAQGASAFVNPLTVLYMMSIVSRDGHRAIVHTAAASALGRMLLRMCLAEGVPLLCVVRRREQADELRDLGAEHVFVTSEDGWHAELTEACERLGATVAFDAVSGPLTGQITAAIQPRGTVYVYGGLSESDVAGVTTGDMIWHGKKVTGLWLKHFLEERNIISVGLIISKAQRLLRTSLSTDYGRVAGFDTVLDAIAEYQRCMTGGKVLICPHGPEAAGVPAASEGDTTSA